MIRSSRRGPRALVALAAAVVVAVVVGACQSPPPPPPPPPPPKPPVLEAACAHTLTASTVGTIASNALDETSGIAASRRAAGVWWVHNDSGDRARVFAIGTDGRDLGEFDLAGASAVDWEDIAVGPGPTAGPSLYVADIGDNAKSRSSVQVYRVAEPLVDPAAAPGPPQTLTGVATLNLTYPDGPHDAEALLVDPSSGDLFVVTKDLVGGVAQVFRAPADLAAGSTTALTQVATVSLGPGQGVTGGDVTPGGDVVALRTYLSVVLYPRPAGQPLGQAFAQAPCAGSAPPFGSATPASEPQGEAIGFTRDGRGYVTVSEGAHPALHQFLAP